MTLRSTDPNVYMDGLLVDDATALATPAQFNGLMEYSSSLPTGQYAGKRWKRGHGGHWLLGEFYETPELDAAGKIGIHWRELLVVE